MNKGIWFFAYIVFALAVWVGMSLAFGGYGIMAGVALVMITLIFMLSVSNRSVGWSRLIWAILCLANSLPLWFLFSRVFPALDPLLAIVLFLGGGVVYLNVLYIFQPKRE